MPVSYTHLDVYKRQMYYGFHKTDDGWYYREWAPKADALYLIGDCNNWDRSCLLYTSRCV